jgi:glycerol kinase
MTYATRDVLDVMRGSAGTDLAGWRDVPLRVDGGAAANDWLMQFQADVLDAPVERPLNIETTALGAAGLAGLATGVWTSPDDFLRARTFHRFDPTHPERAGADHAGWRRAVRTALAWARDPA